MVSIDADIDIDLPNVEKVPVAQVQMRRFKRNGPEKTSRACCSGRMRSLPCRNQWTKEGFQRALEAQRIAAYYEGQDEQDPDVIALDKGLYSNTAKSCWSGRPRRMGKKIRWHFRTRLI
jgi:hypothetical protein